MVATLETPLKEESSNPWITAEPRIYSAEYQASLRKSADWFATDGYVPPYHLKPYAKFRQI